MEEIHVLLADDDADDCLFFKEAVVEILPVGNLTILHDGEQLMNHLTSSLTELPHVLFLDINMPRKNGSECLLEIKQNEKLKGLPVIMFSTSFEQEVVNQLYQNGAQYFIRKPSKFSQFKKVVQQTIAIIAKDNVSKPKRENFVLTVDN